MATVRFSDKLKDEVLRNAKGMFKKERDQAQSNIPVTWSGDYLYNIIFTKDIRDKMNALPDKFLETTSKLSFGGFRNVPQTEDVWNTSDVDFILSAPQRMPNGSTFDDWHKSWRSVSLNFNTPRFATIQAEYKVWATGIKAVEDKQEVFIKGIKQIMNTYSTLGPALKVFPALWDLIPEEYKERHLKITNRKRGDAKELGDLDVNSLTAAVTLNKLTR
jgi:hypothetical protein